MILGIVEHDNGKLNKATLEMFTQSAKVGKIEAVVFGENGRTIATELGAFGIAKVHLFPESIFEEHIPELRARCIVDLADGLPIEAMVISGTETGNELMAHLGARMNLPVASNCTSITGEGNSYLVTRTRWGGSLLEDARLTAQVKLLTTALHTIQPGSFESQEVTIIEHLPEINDIDTRVRVVDYVEDTGDKISLTDARVIISGGRGVGSQEGFSSLEQLAQLLGGAVGCSRAVTNNGWRPHSDQVGQTGARVSPDLYIACGISGAIQHLVGCKGARKILAINTDPEAPMVSKADYAVIADLHEVLPAITSEIMNGK